MIYEQLGAYIKKNIEISAHDLSIVHSYFKKTEKAKYTVLLSEGQTSPFSFFVGKGCLRIFFINKEGKDVTRYIAFENQLATGLSSFISKLPSAEYIEVIEKAELLYISHDAFNHLMQTVPQWQVFYQLYLEKAYVNTNNRLMSFTTTDATERYAPLLKINPALVKRIPNKIVVSYITISQETLSRLKWKSIQSSSK
ncbi:Crp/Fnr family transcriptional regulator [Flavobacterium sp. SM2513]|uniref:Crp/Fnr family transcriptional regulator n=1 Tax=Flavobacterium sp. SM2513 TaxID=3424766 RepID=UPI003D7FCD19